MQDSPRAQLERLCSMVLDPVEIVGIESHASVPESRLGWNRFARVRSKDRGRLGVRTAFGFELCFQQPIAGPICLGYASHFGLGRFAARR